MFEQLSQCEKIEELCLECTRPIDLFDSFGVTSISKLKDLKKLKLWNIINWTASDYVTLFVNGNLKNLVALDLKCFEYINGEVLKTISLECPKLETFYLDFMCDDMHKISHFKNLKHLHIRKSEDVYMDSFVKLFSSGNLNNLIELKFLSTYPNPEINHKVIQSIQNGCPNLKSFEIAADGSPRLKLQSISVLDKLTTLNLGCSKLLPEALVFIFSNRNLENLEVLNISFCGGINCQVLKTIALQCPNLQKLILMQNDTQLKLRNNETKITKFQQALMFLVENCKHLKTLHIGGNNRLSVQLLRYYSYDFLSELKKRVPQLFYDNIYLTRRELHNLQHTKVF